MKSRDLQKQLSLYCEELLYVDYVRESDIVPIGGEGRRLILGGRKDVFTEGKLQVWVVLYKSA